MLLLAKSHGERLDVAESKGYWLSKIVFSLLGFQPPSRKESYMLTSVISDPSRVRRTGFLARSCEEWKRRDF